ncbi:MAG TPA: DUF2917 domain-containing protein [Anaeromyxobacter sp.]|nr:DUF2917 domain-containing protein [Anaeromyxobacter sp.]
MPTMMTISSTTDHAARHLAENEAVRISRPHGAVVVRVERGTVLVTQEDDVEDHVLEAGDELVLARRGLAVAWAFTEATISVREAGPADAPSAPGAFAG